MRRPLGGGVVALDKWGGVHGLKKIAGEKVAGIDSETLPTVEQAKEIQEERRERRAITSLENSYDRGGLVAQQEAALSHHRQRQKALDPKSHLQEREAKAKQQREHEEKERTEQTKREKNGFAARKDHGAQKQAEHAARTEQTDRKQLKQSLEERLWNKRFESTEREDTGRERERER